LPAAHPRHKLAQVRSSPADTPLVTVS